MTTQYTARFQCLLSPLKENVFRVSPASGVTPLRRKESSLAFSSSRWEEQFCVSLPKFMKVPSLGYSLRKSISRATGIAKENKFDDGKEEEDESRDKDDDLMDEDERREWREKIRQVIYMNPDVEEELDPEEKRKKMQKLLAEYPLVVEEDDPDWPDDADGWGFSLDQFFNKISIKNVRKDDDENYDSDKELVWQDDDYIRPIKDITTSEWEETVFKDISPLIVLVHNRYRRPKENERCRYELEKAVNLIWQCRLPSPRCVAIDAVVECDLVSALQVSVFPELIFSKAGKILYREKAIRTADELSKIMAFFYYGAAKPPFFNIPDKSVEAIPSAPVSSEDPRRTVI
ncbi:Thioredoxin-like fold domain-containing protein mrl7l, chloroplastic [Ancistrocladus abbreviatus]